MTTSINRRELLKAHAASLAAASAGIALPAAAQPVPGGVESLVIKWSKAPCRVCGTGCGVLVGVKVPSLWYLPSFMRSIGRVRRSSPYMILERK